MSCLPQYTSLLHGGLCTMYFYNSQLHNVLYFWLKYNVSEMVLKNGSIDKITVQFKEHAIRI